MGKPFVTVVIPAYNEEKYVYRCLDSIASQDYGVDNYEIIVVDNNSVDGTREIIHKFNNVRYFFKKSGPVGAVRNYGVENSFGNIIAFLDSDCVAPRDWLRKGVDLLINSPGSIFGGKYLIDEPGTWVERCWLLPSRMKGKAEKDLLGGCIFIYKSDFLMVDGFNENITSGEDSRLASDLKKIGIKVSISEDVNVVHLGNPKDLMAFVKRQIWHSENYIRNFRDFLADPTFLFSVFFSILFVFFVLSILLGFKYLGLICFSGILVIPFVFSVKRLVRSNLKFVSCRDVVGIYVLDWLYIFGRMLGIYKGIKSVILGGVKK